jgi:cytochrome P450
MRTIDPSYMRTAPVLAAPVPPREPLPFLKYLRTMHDNALAGFHEDAFRKPIVEVKYWRLHTFLVSDPDAIKHVLIDHAGNYVKGLVEQRGTTTGSARNFPQPDEAEWRQRRRTMASSFDYRSIKEHSPTIVDAASRMATRWGTFSRGIIVDIHAEMANLTMEIISRILSPSNFMELDRVMQLVSEHKGGEAILDPIDFVPMFDVVWKIYRRYRRRRVFRDIESAVDCVIESSSKEEAPSQNRFFERLLQQKDSDTGDGLSTRAIHDQIITVLGTGHETAALALMWTWYLLSQHPTQEARLHAELSEVLNGRAPEFADIPHLRYTRMVLEEALRLYPPTHTLPWRGALQDDELCGIRIPKGATVSIVPWVLHRHWKLWRHPDRFDPERFSADRSSERSLFAYLPFGIGPRVCIGSTFVMTEMILILATLAQRFQLRLAPHHVVEAQGLVSLRARYGMKMTLENRC